MPVELFHLIADKESARVRRFIVRRRLKVPFRNLSFEEVEKDFRARGGRKAPALWDGERLYEGADAVIARLEALAAAGKL